MVTYEEYNFENDDKWLFIKRNIVGPPGIDLEKILEKRRQKYFKLHVQGGEDNDGQGKEGHQSSYKDTDEGKPYTNINKGKSNSKTSKSKNKSSPLMDKISMYLSYFQLLCHIFIVFSAIISLIPINRLLSYQSFYNVFRFGVIASIIHTGRTHGKPKFTKEWATMVMRDETTHQIFSNAILMQSHQTLIVILPTAIRSLLWVFKAIPLVVSHNNPFYSQMKPHIEKINGEELKLLAASTHVELLIMVQLVISMIFGTRNIMLMMLWFNFLRTKYLLFPSFKAQFLQTVEPIMKIVRKFKR